MPSFDISCEVDWHEVDNAVNQANKELGTRFDFRGVETEIDVNQKGNSMTLKCSEDGKLDAMRDVLQSKLVKRGVSLFAFEYGEPVPSSGRSVKQDIEVKAGIDKDDGKKIIKIIKESKIKVQGKIQGDTVRVSGNKRDDLQTTISMLKEKIEELKIPMQFGNFRD